MESLLGRELQKLGLSDKEARVYLAALELGYAPIQDIAKKAGINRATTYVIMDQLIHKGIAAHFNKGKKRYFVAEAPDKLMGLLRIRERELEEQRREYKRILPELRSLYNLSDSKPKVLFYEGLDGILAIQDDILTSGTSATYGIAVPDDWFKHFPEDAERDFDKQRRAKKIKSHVVYSSAEPIADAVNDDLTERYWLPSEHFPFEGDITVYDNKVILTTVRDSLSGVVIENSNIANTIRSYYNTLRTIAVGKIWNEKDWKSSVQE